MHPLDLPVGLLLLEQLMLVPPARALRLASSNEAEAQFARSEKSGAAMKPTMVATMYSAIETIGSGRIALATLNLVTKAALEILIANNGGVLVLDEAWTFLSQPEALSALSRISREGRSLNIVPVFLTQRIKDVISRDLEGFMSRVLVLKLNEAEEASAAIRICGLKPTKERLAMLRAAGPRPPKDGEPAVWAQGLFRDLRFRHSWVALGPTPEDAMLAWSANPDDKRRRAEERQLLAEQQAAAGLDIPTDTEDLQVRLGIEEADLQPAPVTTTPVEEYEEGEDSPATVTSPFAEQKPAWAEPVEPAAVDPLPAQVDDRPQTAEVNTPAAPAWAPVVDSEPAWVDPVEPVKEAQDAEDTPESVSPFAEQKPFWAQPVQAEPSPEPQPQPLQWSKPAS